MHHGLPSTPHAQGMGFNEWDVHTCAGGMQGCTMLSFPEWPHLCECSRGQDSQVGTLILILFKLPRACYILCA